MLSCSPVCFIILKVCLNLPLYIDKMLGNTVNLRNISLQILERLLGQMHTGA